MMSPEQVFFVRENLKLRLQGARLALLARQYEAARADLAAASSALGTWFDPASRRTQAAATLLQQVQASTKAADLPRVDDTLVALGNAVAAGSATSPDAAGSR
jgi:uroporphyrin-3 C-methyltransferase